MNKLLLFPLTVMILIMFMGLSFEDTSERIDLMKPPTLQYDSVEVEGVPSSGQVIEFSVLTDGEWHEYSVLVDKVEIIYTDGWWVFKDTVKVAHFDEPLQLPGTNLQIDAMIFDDVLDTVEFTESQHVPTYKSYLEYLENEDLMPVGAVNFDLFGLGAVLTLVSALSVGILAGVRIVGSGVTDTSQIMLFKGIVYLGLWFTLVGGTSPIFESLGTIGMIAISGMSIIYILGFAGEVTGGG